MERVVEERLELEARALAGKKIEQQELWLRRELQKKDDDLQRKLQKKEKKLREEKYVEDEDRQHLV